MFEDVLFKNHPFFIRDFYVNMEKSTVMTLNTLFSVRWKGKYGYPNIVVNERFLMLR